MPYLPPTSHVTFLTTLRRERLLPVPGVITVQANQRVESGEVIGQAPMASQHRVLDLARALGVPVEECGACMLKRAGESIRLNEPIAARKTFLGLARHEVRSPVSGVLISAERGRAVLAAVAKPFELRAGIPGIVVDLAPDRGVILETVGALLEGVWGNGREDFSVLRMMGDAPAAVLSADQIDVTQQAAVLAAGTLKDRAVLEKAASVRLCGLIVGSLPPALVGVAQKLDLPVLVVDGFGSRGFSPKAFTLLTSNNGREVWVNACAWDRYGGARPEAIIPLPSPSAPPPAPVDGEVLKAGKQVRILRGPEVGQVGTVVGMSERPVPLPGGLRAMAATVALERAGGPGGALLVPFANLEILE